MAILSFDLHLGFDIAQLALQCFCHLHHSSNIGTNSSSSVSVSCLWNSCVLFAVYCLTLVIKAALEHTNSY